MEAYSSYLKSKAETAVVKKAYEALSGGLQSLIFGGPDAQLTLPGMDAEDDSWRFFAIEDAIHLTDKQLEKFAEYGVGTMGELEDLRANEGLRAVEGIGEKAADKIEEQMLDWLAQNRTAEPDSDDTEEED